MAPRSARVPPYPRSIARQWRSTTAHSPAVGGRSSAGRGMRMSSLLRGARRRPRALAILIALGATVLVARAGAQRGYFRPSIEPNAEYDGQFTFVRLRYTGWSGRWIADYPAMERNFMTILNDLTTVHPRVGHSNILSWDDPALSRYAVAYVCEPGFWQPTESEAVALRQWIRKGGFLIVDDFYHRQW